MHLSPIGQRYAKRYLKRGSNAERDTAKSVDSCLHFEAYVLLKRLLLGQTTVNLADLSNNQ